MKTTQNWMKLIGLGAASVALWGCASVLHAPAEAAAEKAPAQAAQPVSTQKMAPPKDKSTSNGKSDKVVKTDAEWKRILTPEQYEVLRQKGTEEPGTGALLNNHQKGTFVCAACGKELFSSDTKFESGTGWPSFYQPIKGAVIEQADADGSGRTEVVCSVAAATWATSSTTAPSPQACAIA